MHPADRGADRTGGRGVADPDGAMVHWWTEDATHARQMGSTTP
jgi:hypothetical protein